MPVPQLPRCSICDQPIRLVTRSATWYPGSSIEPEQVWIHAERQPWHGDYYDLRGHNAEPDSLSGPVG
jgi:hypothetical protein